MSDARCHSCGAAVPVEAQWCSLCFADLRTPAPVPEPVSVPAAPAVAPVAVPAPAPAPVPGAAPAMPSAPMVTLTPAPEAPRAPEAAPTVAKEVNWPCPRCGASVPISLDACPDCGAGFLSSVKQVTSTKLPIVGDVGRMSQAQRLMIGAGISIVLMVIFVVILEVFSHLL